MSKKGGLLVRRMAPDDAEAVAEIRVRGWQHSYRGLVPQDHLDGLDVPSEVELRRDQFDRAGARVENLVAEAGGTVVGWGVLGPCRDGDAADTDAEVWTVSDWVLGGRTLTELRYQRRL